MRVLLYAVALLIIATTGIQTIYAVLLPNSVFFPIARQGNYVTLITITERSGNALTNYTVEIILNSSNWDGWGYLATDNCSDIYFTDNTGSPLYYWIAYCNISEKKIVAWVKVPSIPANEEIEIRMYFGGTNPYSDYNDPHRVFIYYEDFDGWTASASGTGPVSDYSLGNGWYITVTDSESDASWSAEVSNGLLVISVQDTSTGDGADTIEAYYILNVDKPVAIEMNVSFAEWNGVGSGSYYRAYGAGFGHSTSGARLSADENGRKLCTKNSSGSSCTGDLGIVNVKLFNLYRIAVLNDIVKIYYYNATNSSWVLWGSKTDYVPDTAMNLSFSVSAWGGYGPFHTEVDYIIVRPFTDPEPAVDIGNTVALTLNINTVYVSNSTVYGNWVFGLGVDLSIDTGIDDIVNVSIDLGHGYVYTWTKTSGFTNPPKGYITLKPQRITITTTAQIDQGTAIAPHLYDWYLDGEDDYIELVNIDPINVSDYFAIETKVYPVFTDHYIAIFWEGGTDGKWRAILGFFETKKLEWWVYNGTVPTNIVVGPYTTEWYRIRAVYDGLNGYLYLNVDGSNYSKEIEFDTSTYPPLTRAMIGDIPAHTRQYKGKISYVMVLHSTSTTIGDTSNLLMLLDPTFYNGTDYIDMATDITGIPYGGVRRVLAEEMWLWVVRGLYSDGYVHLRFFPPGTVIRFIDVSTDRVVAEIRISGSANPAGLVEDYTTSIPSGNYRIEAEIPLLIPAQNTIVAPHLYNWYFNEKDDYVEFDTGSDVMPEPSSDYSMEIPHGWCN